MEYNDGFVSKEHRELARSASESADPLSVSPLQNSVHSRSPKNAKSPNSPGSPNRVGSSKGISSKGSPKKGSPSPLKHERYSHSSKDDRPRKGEAMRGFQFEAVSETCRILILVFSGVQKNAVIIVEEYFAADDIFSNASELRELGMSGCSYNFVKKLVSMSGFCKLVESADDLIEDIPDTADFLVLFIARALVDDMLPPAYLKKQMAYLPAECAKTS
ncbi:hypothetical protein SADUNF_Sadunf02G0051600 [Salix dunnii]|uniref:Uncharacterized protein n=1 Tax=Salix dunnii TaxID=1413687 RepID=A0A835THY7_9ROSI|nr:hypothetical protein SADUNF_Sadunf02G0051600 [Salix dunnii]